MREFIADDSRLARKHVRALLERKRIQCEEAVDGLSGLERLDGEALTEKLSLMGLEIA